MAEKKKEEDLGAVFLKEISRIGDRDPLAEDPDALPAKLNRTLDSLSPLPSLDSMVSGSADFVLKNIRDTWDTAVEGITGKGKPPAKPPTGPNTRGTGTGVS